VVFPVSRNPLRDEQSTIHEAVTHRLSDRLLLDVHSAAEALSISRAQLYRLLQVHAIPSVRIGRSRRIRVADLSAYLEALSSDCEVGR
jgi:excisionase family DNA binding protein